MENSTKKIIEAYYDSINSKDGWQSLLSTDMAFKTGIHSVKGKKIYVAGTEEFLTIVKSCSIKKLIIEGRSACAIVEYKLQSATRHKYSFETAEILGTKNGKINSLAVFFDTVAFGKFMAKG